MHRGVKYLGPKMSIVPVILDDPEFFCDPSQHYYRDLVLRLHSRFNEFPASINELCDELAKKLDIGSEEVKDDGGFEVTMDVHQFKPEELTVKASGNFVTVEGNHEEREDEHGSVSRKFVRRYFIPDECDNEKVETTLSSDGVLTLKIPPSEKPEEPKERIVQIEQVESSDANKKGDKGDKKKKDKSGCVLH